MKPAIRVENLSKLYRIGTRPRGEYKTLRDSIAQSATAFWRHLRGASPRTPQPERGEFWALRGVSFEVQPGEVIGIIGRNGAGKSTLLKILSRITEPTSGRAEFRGRIGSLLEVGTGFHPELTGRENVYLNGSILGMSRREIERRFDEIVAFSEIEQFLDTPVKRYSSGMYVRLAFAVAAHLDPEILIVDEVLAVGDAEFQKKCLGKMRQVSEGGGRTVLFVSHNMNAVAQLCQRAILLRKGLVEMDGLASEVVRVYSERTGAGRATGDLVEHPGRDTATPAIFRRLEVLDDLGRLGHTFAPRSTVVLRIALGTERAIRAPRIGAGFDNWRGERVFAVASHLGPSDLPALRGEAVVVARFELPPLVPGSYNFDLSICDDSGRFLDRIQDAANIEIINDNYLKSTQQYFDGMGSVMVPSEWEATTAARVPAGSDA